METPAETGKANQTDFDEAVFEVVSRYDRAWQLLLEYDSATATSESALSCLCST